MSKNNISFILHNPKLSENIGACARSMKNFGFSKLNIVSPKFYFPNQKTKVTSVGAYDIIKNSKVYKDICGAIGEFDIVISLSARKRDINFQTQNSKGTKAKDTFLTIVQTARKLGVNIYDYIYDRISSNYSMTSLADMILNKTTIDSS